jgi:hypothetical protein
MSSATESSLPTEIVTTYPSSPPFTTRKPSPEEVLFEMNGDPAPKDEQPASEHLNSQASQAAHQRTDSGDTERPPSGQQNHESIDDDMQENTAEEQDGDDSDPADMIEEFDWNDLIQRYHAAMNKCTDEEAHLMQEWSNLMDVRCHPALRLCNSLIVNTVFPNLGRIRPCPRK